MTSSVLIAAYLALFVGVGFAFVLVNLLIGWLVRPSDMHEEKQEIYECGEPAIGSSFVQFDLRFYVVALVFIIFDVEVAFLFPWATVFGKSVNMMEIAREPELVFSQNESGVGLSPDMAALYRELGVRNPQVTEADQLSVGAAGIGLGARRLAALSIVAVMIFFVVLLIGFAYEWRTGALDWVRATTQGKSAGDDRAIGVSPKVVSASQEPVLSA